jgi:hypothetical protein
LVTLKHVSPVLLISAGFFYENIFGNQVYKRKNKMFSYTTIATDNDAIHIQSMILKDTSKGYYHTDPSITFYDLQGDDHRNPDHIIMAIWDNPEYLTGDLYNELSKFHDLDDEAQDDYQLPVEIETVLIGTGTYPEDLLAILEKAIELGLLIPKSTGPFKTINSFFKK